MCYYHLERKEHQKHAFTRLRTEINRRSSWCEASCFLSKENIISAGSRCCPNYLQQNVNDLNPTADTTPFNKTSNTQLIKFLRSEVLIIDQTRVSFDNSENLTDTEYMDIRGISKALFQELLTYIEDTKVRSTPAISVCTNLAIFLMKLREVDSDRILSILIIACIPKSSVYRSINSIRTAFNWWMADLVKKTLDLVTSHDKRSSKNILDHWSKLVLVMQQPSRPY